MAASSMEMAGVAPAALSDGFERPAFFPASNLSARPLGLESRDGSKAKRDQQRTLSLRAVNIGPIAKSCGMGNLGFPEK
jgi:hypothetical protein